MVLKTKEPVANHRRVRAKFSINLNSMSVPGRCESETLWNWVLQKTHVVSIFSNCV